MEYFLIDIIRYYIEDAQLGVYGNTEIVWQDSRPQPIEQQIEERKQRTLLEKQKKLELELKEE